MRVPTLAVPLPNAGLGARRTCILPHVGVVLYAQRMSVSCLTQYGCPCRTCLLPQVGVSPYVQCMSVPCLAQYGCLSCLSLTLIEGSPLSLPIIPTVPYAILHFHIASLLVCHGTGPFVYCWSLTLTCLKACADAFLCIIPTIGCTSGQAWSIH